ncbi:hypothetical protein EW026_g3453 [Hermanssonia centrifuga]|uniref:Rhamnogalacturonase A/B/Epimerase-like pectate lyase domain-containing protein n=1 Tax=Hermanssonia centrifuga TaxID=98765 RepID=A0A4S4KK10_9APHY|nr:hypothetical protein EW026_g3453 [Hermanssonia centrifuga]
MFSRSLRNALLGAGTLLGLLTTTVHSLGSTCSTPLTHGSAAAGDPFWRQNIAHQGIAAFNSNPSGYQVFRNVKDFGAIGDGNADDTAAINAAISSGSRCGEGCDSTTTAPAIVYFPSGSYKVSTPLIALYQTQLIGDARNPPTLLAAPSFSGIALIGKFYNSTTHYADPYLGDNWQYYTNQNNFFRSVRNFVIDLRQVSGSATGIHWQVSQATSLMNIVFQMSTAAGNQHQGIFMENGSGGFLGDLVINGGNIGATFGNQQFTVRNVTFNNPINAIWNWGWTFQGVTINNAQVGFDLSIGDTSSTGNQGVGAEAIIDAVVTNTPIFVRSSIPSNGHLQGSIVLNNIKLTNVPIAVGVKNGATVLAGGSMTIDSWAQGNVFKGTNSAGTFTQGNIASIPKAPAVLDSAGRIFGKSHPQYADYSPSDFVSVRSHGAKGDGHTDDTAALQAIFAQYAGCKIIFFDAGTYIVSNTINIPAEITDMIFTTKGPAAGAIIVEWNVHDPAGQQGAAGAWDTHLIIGGIAGSGLQAAQCPSSGSGGNSCFADYLGLHLTSGSSAYIEGMWVWLADHDLDTPGSAQITLYSGRGVLSESQGPVWLIGTASEHHVNYQYFLRGAANHYIGLAQTETPYFQPNPVPPSPFIPSTNVDPATLGVGAAWALTVQNAQNILVFGAGFYSFFNNYNTACQGTQNCQQQILNLDSVSTISIYSLNTVDAISQISVNANAVISGSSNPNGFSNTVTAWTRN